MAKPVQQAYGKGSAGCTASEIVMGNAGSGVVISRIDYSFAVESCLQRSGFIETSPLLTRMEDVANINRVAGAAALSGLGN
jgi:hypothetical protein